MTKKLLAFAASNSKNSINKRLATYAASLVQGVEVEILDLNDYELPIFSVDRHKESGIPALAKQFYAKIGDADGLIISFAEYNGSYTSAYKNLFDWTSFISQKVYQNKPMIALATSPGPGGAQNVLQQAVNSLPHFDAELIGDLSIPEFEKSFDSEKNALVNSELKEDLLYLASALSDAIKQ